jgi:serine/threonine-protein kinase
VLFEMLTGKRPFAAENPAATLNALLNRAPLGVEVLRQTVPAVLVELILQMLEKDPGRRLFSLDEAVLVLRRYRDGVETQRIVPRPGFLRSPRAPHWLPLLFTAALGLLLYFFSEPGVSSRQLRVFLAQPEYYREGAATPLDAVIWSSVINGLHLLGSVQPVLYHQPPVEGSNPAQLAKLAGSDEWIHISLQPENPLGNVQLQRVRTHDGALLEQTQFAVPQEYVNQSAQAVFSQILALYGDIESPQSVGYSSLSADHYDSFVEIYSSLNQGVGNRQELFKDLRTLVTETPGFLAAEVLVVDLAHDLFTDTDDTVYLDRSAELIDRLRLYHPNPTVVLQREITLATDRGEIGRAEQLLGRLTELSPGDPAVLMTQSRLAELRGDLTGATRLILEAAAVSPLPWKIRYRATTLAIRSGDVEAAQTHIAEVLKLTPDNTLVQGQSGLVELLYGDVDRAIGIYKQLLERKQHRSYRVNLGLALMLKESFQDARDEFARALDLQPEHRVAMLNLADAEMALGNRKRALDLYRNILELQQRRSGSGDASDKMVKAQCLAHLGQYSLAIEHTLGALTEALGDPEIAYQAALVYALAGEYESALVNARVALQGGMDSRWFKLPAFSNTPVALLSESSGIR